MLENDYASVENMAWAAKNMIANLESQFGSLYFVSPLLELQKLLYIKAYNILIDPTGQSVCSWQKSAVMPSKERNWH